MGLLLCTWHCAASRVSKIRSSTRETKPYSGGLSDSITEWLRARALGSDCPGHGHQKEGWQVTHKKNIPTWQSFPNSALLPDGVHLLSQRPNERVKSELLKSRMLLPHIFVAQRTGEETKWSLHPWDLPSHRAGWLWGPSAGLFVTRRCGQHSPD